MRQRLSTSVCLLAAAALVRGESLPAARWNPVVERCAGEISQMHGVWRSPEVFLPAFADLHLIVYMASLGAHSPGLAVIPVFSAEPVRFRSHHAVFLSTGFILQAHSDVDLAQAIRTAPLEVRSPPLPSCAAIAPPPNTGFPDVQRRLQAQVAGYRDVTVRRLRFRDK